MRLLLRLLLLLAPAVLAAMDTYTWVDANNERHWSDTPRAGAERVELTPLKGYQSPPLAPARAARTRAAGALPAALACAITQPVADQVLFQVDSLTIIVSVTPEPGPGATVSATYDGTPLAASQPGGSRFVVSPVDRGTHVAAAAVHDASGRVLCSAPPVSFHVRQHSVIKPR
ncbi:MAG: DUF4124 domain-containing protein [Gammaproteobacteria bacterium]|nr:DUF4124 domain-containing protein [Gammaproteobacteria bacterium]